MRCDIHLFVEYNHPQMGMEPVIANLFWLPRDEQLFCALSGRNGAPLPSRYPPRGLPPDVSSAIFFQYFLEVLPRTAEEWRKNLGHAWCYEEDAERFVRENGAVIRRMNGQRYLANPDWRDASHLNLDEVREAMEFSQVGEDRLSPEFLLVLDCMQAIDRRFGERSSRIVYWFNQNN